MDTLRNNENGNAFGVRSKNLRSNAIRKPLRGVDTNKIRSIPIKAPLKEKDIAAKENIIKEQKLTKPVKVKEEIKVFQNVVELERCLPIIESHSTKQLPSNVENIDLDDVENPQLVSIYINDIYDYLRKLEVQFPVKKYHLQLQPEITGKMRAILVDWLIQVHLRFHLLQETLYMTVSILDRYLQIEKVKRSNLQLVGVTAMFIASKYEEMYAPDISDFVYITDNTYSKQDILKMERIMLKKLDFELSRPLPLHFLRRNSKAGNVDASVHTLAKYLMEIVLTEYECSYFRPSLLAAAALYLSLKLLTETSWTDTLKFYSQYSEEDFMAVVKYMCKILLKSESSKLQAVHLKYSSAKLFKVSTLPQLKSAAVIELAGPKN